MQWNPAIHICRVRIHVAGEAKSEYFNAPTDASFMKTVPLVYLILLRKIDQV